MPCNCATSTSPSRARADDRRAAAPTAGGASVTLLTEMLQRPLDPGYAAAAARRAASGTATPAASRSPALLLACVLVGLLLAVAATTLGSGTSRTATVRGDLISRIESRRTEAETTTAAIAAAEPRSRHWSGQRSTGPSKAAPRTRSPCFARCSAPTP